MITVELFRSGVTSKKYPGFNRGQKGSFKLTFNTMEDVVKYCRSNCCSVYFTDNFNFTPEQKRLFIMKYRAMLKKHYPSIDHKRDKSIRRRQSRHKLI